MNVIDLPSSSSYLSTEQVLKSALSENPVDVIVIATDADGNTSTYSTNDDPAALLLELEIAKKQLFQMLGLS